MSDSVPVLEALGLGASYGGEGREHVVLADVSLRIGKGEFVCVVGASGIGKTTLLRCLAGLLAPTAGGVRFEGVPIDGPPQGVGVVFQDYGRSLLAWKTVRSNVLLPLKGKGLARGYRSAVVADALDAVGLSRHADKLPHQLSGGMQQRVAIARALAYRAEVLIMDEPFGSVDAQTRADLEDLLLELRDRYGTSIVLVTHDVDEAAYLADRVVVLGGVPARITRVVTTDLGSRRDQIDTKALPRFAEIRATVLRELRRMPPRPEDAP